MGWIEDQKEGGVIKGEESKHEDEIKDDKRICKGRRQGRGMRRGDKKRCRGKT